VEDFFLGAAIVISLMAVMTIYRAVAGPTDIDRIISVGAIGTKTVILLLLMGLIYKRLDMFVDIALCYAIINFVGTLLFAKYFNRKGVL